MDRKAEDHGHAMESRCLHCANQIEWSQFHEEHKVVSFRSRIMACPWYHGRISDEEVSQILYSKTSGDFIYRIPSDPDYLLEGCMRMPGTNHVNPRVWKSDEPWAKCLWSGFPVLFIARPSRQIHCPKFHWDFGFNRGPGKRGHLISLDAALTKGASHYSVPARWNGTRCWVGHTGGEPIGRKWVFSLKDLSVAKMQDTGTMAQIKELWKERYGIEIPAPWQEVLGAEYHPHCYRGEELECEGTREFFRPRDKEHQDAMRMNGLNVGADYRILGKPGEFACQSVATQMIAVHRHSMTTTGNPGFWYLGQGYTIPPQQGGAWESSIQPGSKVNILLRDALENWYPYEYEPEVQDREPLSPVW